jgi:hypothetical protein
VRTIGDALPREGTVMIQGGQGYGLGRPAQALPDASARIAPASRFAA